MAKSRGDGGARVPIKAAVMRELMFASGGRCAMTGCGLSLISPSGGWIGTIAHIVGAVPTGPRGANPLSLKERAAVDNLILMCATHGREVDAPDTGEANFPTELLRLMKKAHEAKVTEAVAAAVRQDVTGATAATGAIDTALRAATTASTAAGLAESLALDPAGSSASKLVADLDRIRADLQKLSQHALDVLSELLALWMMHCRQQDGTYSFDPPMAHSSPAIPEQNVKNRVKNKAVFTKGETELRTREILELSYDEDTHTADYLLNTRLPTAGSPVGYFWPAAADFLYEGYGVPIGDWVRGLDFSIFDRPPPADRDVPWRD